MKKIIVLFFLAISFAGFQAQAGADAEDIFKLIGKLIEKEHKKDHNDHHSSYPPPGYGGGPVRCIAEDEGYEEHSRGHRSCGECLSVHGQCVETCYTETVACTASGIDYQGRQRTVVGQDQDRWYAERRALEYCRYEGLRQCRIENCQGRQDTISERLCRY